MIRSGRFYEAGDKGKWVAEEKKKEEENVEDAVLQQFKKISAQVNILELLCSSQEHRNAIVEALSRIIVPADAESI